VSGEIRSHHIVLETEPLDSQSVQKVRRPDSHYFSLAVAFLVAAMLPATISKVSHYLVFWLLGLTAIGYALVFHHKIWQVLKQTGLLGLGLASYPVWAAFNVLWHDIPLSAAESASYFLLCLLILPLVACQRVSATTLWWGAWVAGLVFGTVAAYDVWVLGDERASRWLFPLQLSMFSIVAVGLIGAGLPYFIRLTRGYPLVAFGAFGAALASALSLSRTGWLALPILAVMLYSRYRHRDPAKGEPSPRMSPTTKMLFGGVFVLLLAIGGPRLGKGVVEFMAYYSLHDNQTSVGLRLDMWREAINQFASNPIHGIGLRQFQKENVRALETGRIELQAIRKFDHAHNQYLDTLASGGLLGVLALALVFGGPLLFFLKAWRDDQGQLAFAGIWVVLAFLVFGLTEVTLFHKRTLYVYGSLVAIIGGMLIAGNTEKQQAS
jgi:O-antigen ligase